MKDGTSLVIAGVWAQSNSILRVDPERKIFEQTVEGIEFEAKIALVEKNWPLAFLKFDEANVVLGKG